MALRGWRSRGFLSSPLLLLVSTFSSTSLSSILSPLLLIRPPPFIPYCGIYTGPVHTTAGSSWPPRF